MKWFAVGCMWISVAAVVIVVTLVFHDQIMTGMAALFGGMACLIMTMFFLDESSDTAHGKRDVPTARITDHV